MKTNPALHFLSLFRCLPLLALWLLPSPSNSTVLGDLANSMQPNTWAELKNTNGFNGGTILTRCVHSMLAFCNEIKWDSAGGKVYILGSGHGDWATSNCIGFVTYDDAANTWATLPKPFWYSETPHGYDHTAFDQENRIIYHKTAFTESVYKYVISTGQWTKIAGAFDQNVDSRFGGLEYFPELDALFWNREPYLLNLSNNQWQAVPNTFQNKTPSGEWPYNNYAEYDPVHRLMIYGGGNGSLNLYTLDATKKISWKKLTPFGLGINASIEYTDTRTGKFVVYREDGSNEMWHYDVSIDAWEQLPGKAPFRTDYGNWMNLVGGWINTYGVGFYVQWDGSNSKIYLYKPPATPAAAETSRGSGTAMSMETFPNPFRGNLTIRLGKHEANLLVLSAYDLKGRRLAEWKRPSSEGAYPVLLNTAHWPAGVYLLKVRADGVVVGHKRLFKS